MSTNAEQPTALVTGASRGIGLAILRALAKDGFLVHGTATTNNGSLRITKELSELDNKGSGHVYDASNASGHTDLTNTVTEVDALVCNAGITKDMLCIRMGDDAFEQVIDVNLIAPFRLAKYYLRGMLKKRRGSIVMISSVIAATGNPGQANYAASKAGLEGMVRSLAREVGSRNITVNAVAPGFVDTDMTSRSLVGDTREKLLEQIPLGRVGTTQDIAATVSFLLSAQARYITGATIPVNGGLNMA